MAQGSDFGSFGRYEECQVDQMSAEMKDAYELIWKLRGLVPGAHRICLANRNLSKTIVPTGGYFQTQLADIWPTGWHATELAQVQTGDWS